MIDWNLTSDIAPHTLIMCFAFPSLLSRTNMLSLRFNSFDDALACVVAAFAVGDVALDARQDVPLGTVELYEDGQLRFSGAAQVLQYLFFLLARDNWRVKFTPVTMVDTMRFIDLAVRMTERDNLPIYLDALNEHLLSRTYLDGDSLSFGDVIVYVSLITNKRWNFLKNNAEKYFAVIRWTQAVVDTDSDLFYRKALGAALAAMEEKNQQLKQQKIEQSKSGSFEIDLPNAEMGKVVTRFPPEPSGYLHIGHFKALFLNHYIAKKFQGKMILRFDDTNPAKEKDEFVENIMSDMRTLGLDWVGPTYTSDYFDLMAEMCVDLIKRGIAYCDNTDVNTMREERGQMIESKCRNNSVEENLRVWELMWNGHPEGQQYCVRAKIDMKSPNGCMRDPTIYRCSDVPHHRTGTKYKCYPTYDFACPIVDSIEGVTHCLRTIEYHDRNEQYSWMCKILNLREPVIWDYSRLNFTYTLLSKRKLQWFVDNGLVEGWFDPRFPTVQGIIRRGLLVESLKDFMLAQGASKNLNLMEWDKLWANNKAKLEVRCSRLNAVLADNMVPFELQDVAEYEVVTQPLVPKSPELGVKAVVRGPVIYLEQQDAKEIKDGEEITLITWGNAIVESVHRDANGVVTKLVGRTNLAGNVKATSKKLHWISKKNEYDFVAVTLVEYGHLITVPKLEEDDDVRDVVNRNSKRTEEAFAEQALRSYNVGDIVQFQRKGFYRIDAVTSVNGQSKYTMIYIPDGRKEKK